MSEPGKPPSGSDDRAKAKQFLVPAVAIAGVVVLAALVIYVSGGTARKMSDGSYGGADDPDVKETSPSSGVKYRDLKEGMGEPCPPGAGITIQYTGWITDGTVFDSTREGAKATGKPTTFKLRSLIKGWQEGIPGMKKGGVRKLVIAPEKGYGKAGQPPTIKPDATLIFEIEMIDFTPPAPGETRTRRVPHPSDLTSMFDGTDPGADDPGLKPLGSGGLKYRDLKVGDGAEVPAGSMVTVDYIGWLTKGGEPFDSSWRRQEPSSFTLKTGRDGVIAGWVEGVAGMRLGGIRKLVIPPELAYGANGKPPSIPPNATLVFEIEALGFD
jgi:peptidylprolyl isomerase